MTKPASELIALADILDRVRDALKKIELASRKDSLTDHERLQSVRTIVCAAISESERPRTTDQSSSERAGVGALRDIAAERQRQIDAEGFDSEHDDRHTDGSIASAAACYAYIGGAPNNLRRQLECRSTGAPTLIEDMWEWSWSWFKPKDNRSDLIRAGALVVAEIERLDRATPPAQPAPASGVQAWAAWHPVHGFGKLPNACADIDDAIEDAKCQTILDDSPDWKAVRVEIRRV